MLLTRRVLLGSTAGLAVVAAAGCSGGGGDDVVRLGLNYELSGGVATYGQASVDGIQMAVDEINAKGIKGKKVELVKYDNKSDAAEATTLATKLMSSDKVIAVMGPATSNNFKATIPVALRNKVPVASGSATADDVTVDAGGVKEYAFRICFNDSFQGTIMAKFANGKLNAKTAVIIKDTGNDYSKGLAEAFTKQFTELGGKILGEEGYVTGGEDSFNAIVTRVKGQNPEVIYLPGYYNEAGLIIKAAREQGLNVPVLGADGFDSPTLLEKGGAAALNDVYFTNHYSTIDSDPAVAKFIEDFKKKYNTEPNAFHALGYDLGKFVCDAVERADAFTGEAVKNAMAATKGFKGVTGTFDVDENHNPVKSIVVIGLKDGKQATSEKIA